ncbi:hypothetical protein TNCV_768731 [Trichonephila clavipes]|nr:hypothetical protein TNCV_768731 [Trichonephila clavipes]
MVRNSRTEYNGFEPCKAAEDLPCREDRCTIKSVEAQCPRVDVVQSLGEKVATAQVSISLLDQGSPLKSGVAPHAGPYKGYVLNVVRLWTPRILDSSQCGNFGDVRYAIAYHLCL